MKRCKLDLPRLREYHKIHSEESFHFLSLINKRNGMIYRRTIWRDYGNLMTSFVNKGM